MSSWWAEGRSNQIPPKGSPSMCSNTPSRRSLQKNSINKEKNEWTCLCVRKKKRPGRWSQADSCRSMQAGCASFLSGLHSIYPAQCFMQRGSLVSVCALNENGGSHPVMRKSHQGIWGGRQKDIQHGCNSENRSRNKNTRSLPGTMTSLPLHSTACSNSRYCFLKVPH